MKNSRYRLLFLLILTFGVIMAITACTNPLPLKVPTGVKRVETNLVWGEVDNATGYVVQIDQTTYPADTNSLDISTISSGEHTVKVKALGDGEKFSDSAWSFDVTINVPYIYNINYLETKNAGNTNPDFYTDESQTIILANLSANGYDFLGWYDDSQNKITKIETGTTGNLELTARWSLRQGGIPKTTRYHTTTQRMQPTLICWNIQSKTSLI